MQLTQYQQDVYSGHICPYCKSPTKVVSEEFIYGRSYKNRSIICCVNYPECEAYCGTHEEDGSSLGRLAKKPLRKLKNEAHRHFDRLWMEGYYEKKRSIRAFKRTFKASCRLYPYWFFRSGNLQKSN